MTTACRPGLRPTSASRPCTWSPLSQTGRSACSWSSRRRQRTATTSTRSSRSWLRAPGASPRRGGRGRRRSFRGRFPARAARRRCRGTSLGRSWLRSAIGSRGEWGLAGRLSSSARTATSFRAWRATPTDRRDPRLGSASATRPCPCRWRTTSSSRAGPSSPRTRARL